MSDKPLPNLDAWIAELAPALGLGEVDVPLRPLLDLTRDVAHNVARPPDRSPRISWDSPSHRAWRSRTPTRRSPL